jgi:hypothetical protein
MAAARSALALDGPVESHGSCFDEHAIEFDRMSVVAD